MSDEDRPRRPTPRNYFSRSEQYRLLVLVFSLLLVLVLMFEAAQPANWEWMWRGARSSSLPAEDPAIDTRIPPTVVSPSPDVFVSPAPANAEPATDARPGMLDEVAGIDLSAIRDNTVLRGDERPAWNELLDILNHTDEAALAASSLGPAGFTQLFRQPHEYRGRTVTVSGTVRRAFPLDAISNEFGIGSYWQCWLFPDGSLNPIVVYALHMPDGFPSGMSVRERVEFDGIFFKRWAYAAERDTRTAPLVLARQPRWQPTPAAPVSGRTSSAQIMGIVLFALLAAILVTRFIWMRTQWVSPRDDDTSSPGTTSMGRAHTVVFACGLGVASSFAPALAQDKPVAAPAAVQQYLDLFDLVPQRLAAAARDGGTAPGEHEIAVQALRDVFLCLQRCTPAVLSAAALPAEEWLESPGAPAAGQAVRLRGQLLDITAVTAAGQAALPAASAAWYRCEIAIELPVPRGVTVLAQLIPARWAAVDKQQLLDQRVACRGILLDNSAAAGPTVATTRLAWHPRESNPALQVTADQVLLANHGLDVGQLDEVKARGPLTAADRAAFYQSLLAVGRASSADLRAASRHVNVTRLLQPDESDRGKFFEIAGTARRCVRVLVTDSDMPSEFGISSYYELVVFADPDAIVRVRSADDAEADAKIFATYPVVVCVRDVPAGFPEGEDIHAGVKVVGCYFKMWGYPSQFMQVPGKHRLQYSPLLIGKAPEWLPGTALEDPLSGPTIPIVFAAGLFFLCGLVWWWSRGDQRFRRETLSRNYELPEGAELDERALGEPAEPARFVNGDGEN